MELEGRVRVTLQCTVTVAVQRGEERGERGETCREEKKGRGVSGGDGSALNCRISTAPCMEIRMKQQEVKKRGGSGGEESASQENYLPWISALCVPYGNVTNVK